MATKRDIEKVIAILVASYPNFRPKVSAEQMAQAYTILLRDLEADRLMMGAEHHASWCKWFPSAAELRKAYHDLQDHDVPTAEQAWEEAKTLISRHLWYVPQPSGKTRLVFRDMVEADCSHALVWRTINAMGLKAMRESDAPGVDRAHFRQFYNSFKDTARAKGAMLPEIRAAVEGKRAERLPERARRY